MDQSKNIEDRRSDPVPPRMSVLEGLRDFWDHLTNPDRGGPVGRMRYDKWRSEQRTLPPLEMPPIEDFLRRPPSPHPSFDAQDPLARELAARNLQDLDQSFEPVLDGRARFIYPADLMSHRDLLEQALARR